MKIRNGAQENWTAELIENRLLRMSIAPLFHPSAIPMLP
jgi:hypothetical protein